MTSSWEDIQPEMEKIRLVLDRNDGSAAEVKAQLIVTQSKLDSALVTIKDLRQQIADMEKPEPEARFPGDLGPNRYRVGWALERGTASGWDLAEAMAQPWWNDKVTLIHDYARSSAKFVDRASVTEIFKAGFEVASQSCKLGAMGSSWDARAKSVLSGAQNATIDADADWCKAQEKPIHLAIYHEPEDLTGAAATQLRDVTRFIAARFKARGVTNVVFQPVYQVPYTFELVSGKPRRDFKIWHPDWNGTGWHTDKVCATFGGDVYNPLPGGKATREFSKMWDDAWNVVKADKMPLVPRTMPEFGMGRTVPADGWLAWAKRAVTYAKSGDVVTFTYWDNSDDIGRYRLTDPDKKEAWDYICANAG